MRESSLGVTKGNMQGRELTRSSKGGVYLFDGGTIATKDCLLSRGSSGGVEKRASKGRVHGRLERKNVPGGSEVRADDSRGSPQMVIF